jgi:hypothetical protein
LFKVKETVSLIDWLLFKVKETVPLIDWFIVI